MNAGAGAGYYQVALLAVALAAVIIVLINRIERHVLEAKKVPADERGGED